MYREGERLDVVEVMLGNDGERQLDFVGREPGGREIGRIARGTEWAKERECA